MEVAESYTKILGIEEPWSIADVELDEKQSLIRVQLEHDEGKHWKCPCCDRGVDGLRSGISGVRYPSNQLESRLAVDRASGRSWESSEEAPWNCSHWR